MSDSDNNNKPPAAVPAWQQEASAEATAKVEQPPQQDDADQQLEVARRFLDEEEVKTASRGKKAQFLKSKGISDDNIEKLLGKSDQASESSPQVR